MGDDGDGSAAKRRRREASSEAKLPQKKRKGDEDGEALLRETEAALKSLSGSWPGPRASFYTRGLPDAEPPPPPFENLFEEKKVKMSPGNGQESGCSSDDGGKSLESATSPRDAKATPAKPPPPPPPPDPKDQSAQSVSPAEHDKGASGGGDLDNLLKMESECPPAPPKVTETKRDFPASRYEPDFNELVDDSSNELEIDMSDPSGVDKDDDAGHAPRPRCKEEQTSNPEQAQPPPPPPPPPVSFSPPASAFRAPPKVPPPIDPLGPFPAAATFVGYPGGGVPDKTGVVKTELLKVAPPTQTATKVDGSKQYTVLQPAGSSQDVVVSVEPAKPSLASPSSSRPGKTPTIVIIHKHIF